MTPTDRRTYIGGSDIVAIMGLDSQFEYANWTSVWNKFTQYIDVDFDEDRGHIRRGNHLEPEIERYVRAHIDPSINSAEMFMQFDTENDIDNLSWDEVHDGGNPWDVINNVRPQIFVRDEVTDYLAGHLDGLGTQIVHEMKAPALHNIEFMQTYGCKWQYIVQAQFYMMLTRRVRGQIHVWDYDLWEPITFPQIADEDLWARMRSTCDYFWKCCQQKEVPSLEWQRRMGYQHLFSNIEMDELADQYYHARENRKLFETLETKLKPKMMSAVRALWLEEEKKVQFSTRRYLINCSEYMRGETPVTRLTIKQNEIPNQAESVN